MYLDQRRRDARDAFWDASDVPPPCGLPSHWIHLREREFIVIIHLYMESGQFTQCPKFIGIEGFHSSFFPYSKWTAAILEEEDNPHVNKSAIQWNVDATTPTAAMDVILLQLLLLLLHIVCRSNSIN